MNHFLSNLYIITDNPFIFFIFMFLSGLANIFFPPIPIEAGTLFAGYLYSTGHGSLIILILSVSSGMILGSLAVYFISAQYGEGIIKKKPFNKLISEPNYKKMSILFQKYGVWSLFAAKIIPGLNFCAVLCSGIFKLSKLKAFLGFTGSNLIFFTFLALSGSFAGKNWKKIYLTFNKIGTILLITFILSTFLIFLFFKLRKKKQNLNS